VLTAGDIGCGLIAGGGMSPGGACQQAATASLLGAAGVVAVLPLGDNEYECGELSNFQSFYGPSWGQYKSLTYPVVGNHEYLTTGGATPCLTTETQAGAPGYFTYFGNAASPQQAGCTVACKGYYSFDLGAWHLVALNAECGSPGVGGCGSGSPQETWLKADLAAHANRCILAYWHQPRFTSGQEGDTAAIQAFWSDLYDARADIVLNGHDHDYERFGQLGKISTTDGSGAEHPVVDPRGMREIVVGTGGRNLTRFPGGFKTGSQVHDSSSFGVLKLSLHATSYDWSFLPAGSATFTDSGTTSCRFATAPLDTTAPAAPTGLQVSATSTSANLSWAAATDNVGVAAYRVLRNGALIATIGASNPAYVDAAVVAGQSDTYAVQAVDAAGNQSASSSAVTVVIPQSSVPDIFSDGFDSGAFGAWDAGSALNTTVESPTVHTGTGAAESNVLNAAYRVTKTLPSTYPEVFVRAYFELHSKSTNAGIYRIRTAAGIDIVHLYVDSASGQLGIRNDVTGVATLSGHAITLDSWHAIETRTLINGASSTVQVWLDGVDQVALDSTTNLGTTNIGQVMIGDTNARTLDAFWDDVAVADARIGS
jgi:acid phosphatase type 7